VAHAVSDHTFTEGIDEGAQGLTVASDEKVRDWPSAVNQDMLSYL
jgi:hypothetical protein